MFQLVLNTHPSPSLACSKTVTNPLNLLYLCKFHFVTHFVVVMIKEGGSHLRKCPCELRNDSKVVANCRF